MNYLTVGDLHFKNNQRRFNKKLFKSKLETGLKINNPKDKKLSIIFSGDFLTLMNIYQPPKNFWNDGEKNVLGMISRFLKHKKYEIENIFYVLGNHDFWITPSVSRMSNNSHFFDNDYFVKKHLNYLFNQYFGCNVYCLEDGPIVLNDELFVGNILYSPFLGKDFFNIITKNIKTNNTTQFKTFNHLIKKTDNRYGGFKRLGSRPIYEDIKELLESMLNYNTSSETWEFLQNAYTYIKETFANNKDYDLFLKATHFFLYNYLKIIKNILGKGRKVKKINIITHFPFDSKGVEQFLDVEFKRDYNWNTNHAPNSFSDYFKIKGFWFENLMRIIEKETNVLDVMFVSGHTHNTAIGKGMWMGIDVDYIMHSLSK